MTTMASVLNNGTDIRFVHARRVWDSRGRPTVEAEVRLQGGAVGRAIVPAGASRGSREALELRDGGQRLGGLDVTQAVAHVNGEIARVVLGAPADDQREIDERLIELDGTPDKHRLGANAIVAVSLACAHTLAAAAKVPLWKYLAGKRASSMPVPQIQIFGGGAHAHGAMDLQDFMIICNGAGSFTEGLALPAMTRILTRDFQMDFVAPLPVNPDAYAYYIQARIFARGEWFAISPPEPFRNSFNMMWIVNDGHVGE